MLLQHGISYKKRTIKHLSDEHILQSFRLVLLSSRVNYAERKRVNVISRSQMDGWPTCHQSYFLLNLQCYIFCMNSLNRFLTEVLALRRSLTKLQNETTKWCRLAVGHWHGTFLRSMEFWMEVTLWRIRRGEKVDHETIFSVFVYIKRIAQIWPSGKFD